MKTKNLLPILLLAVSMVSCTTYYQVKTQVFPDGSARREVYAFGDSAFMAGNRAQNPFMFSLDSGWTVMRFDSVRMHNYFGEKEKINVCASREQASVDLFSEQVRPKDPMFRPLVTPRETLTKHFRWFYTYYTYNGVYPEPLYGENNRPEVIPEYLCHTDWWYRNEVMIPDSYKNKTIWLNFDGINYSADVWINGRRVGPIKGAFIRGNFDITPFVKPGQTAIIAVRISPQPNTGVPFEHIMGTVGGPCGGVGRLDGPTFGCSNGWDWLSGIRDRNSGIWQDVFLSATGHVLMKDPLITSDLPLPHTDIASVTVQTTVQNTTGKVQKGIIKGSFDNIKFEKKVEIAPWRTLTFTFDPKDFAQLNIKNPKLWWPNGLGEQNLYSMHLSFEIDGKVSDEKEVTFGIREVSYDIPGSDNLGLTVNGVRIFCKGGNWGLDEALKRIDPKRLEAQIRMHKDANFNMIRLWGRQAASKILYDLCDKYGIMIWDEFWQFNAADPLDQDLYMANVRDKILPIGGIKL